MIRRISCLASLLFLLVAVMAAAQTAQQASGQPEPELNQRDEMLTFKVNVKLVLVRVVVRDAKGQAVGNLQKQDFEVFDKGKPQIVSEFEAIHTPQSPKRAGQRQAESPAPPDEPAAHRLGKMPDQYTAYLFDDQHLALRDLMAVREAVLRHLDTMQINGRAAIFTTTGRTILDFTDDRPKFKDALARVNPSIAPIANQCPRISYYEADLIINQNNSEAKQVATQAYLACSMLGHPRTSTNQADSGPAVRLAAAVIPAYAQTVLSEGDAESRRSLAALQDVIKRMSVMPGQRSIVYISSGFLTPRMQTAYDAIIDRALRAQIVVNAIDARGAYVVLAGGDVQQRLGVIDPNPGPTLQNGNEFHASPSTNEVSDPSVLEAQYEEHAATAQAEILASLAEETGGIFVHNTNNFDTPLTRLGPPEYSYLLGFKPEDVKADGRFHKLKVVVKGEKGLTIQARRGYFAANGEGNPVEQAKAEMMDALFSQDEVHELPVELHTQFFKTTEENARLTVLAHVDVNGLRYHKDNGRNDNVLTCDSALFNSNGDYVQGMQKVVNLHLKDQTLAKLTSGIVLKSSFENVKPGNYMVRLVVRDQQGQMMSAQTGTVDIP